MIFIGLGVMGFDDVMNHFGKIHMWHLFARHFHLSFSYIYVAFI